MQVRRFLTFTAALLAFLIGMVWMNRLASMKIDLEKSASINRNSEQFSSTVQLAIQEKWAELEIVDTEIDDSTFNQILELPWLETLIVDEGVLTDLSAEKLKSFERLRHLRLRMSPISDEGMMHISQIESLWYLNIPHAQCSEVGVSYLQKLPALRQLRLSSPDLGNAVANEIAAITTLRSLHLIGVPITDQGLRVIATLPNLQSLYLDDSMVSEDGWEWLFEEAPHLHVHVNQKHHDRDVDSHDHDS